MRRIFFFLEQLEFFGGSETVDITLMNELVKYYKIHLAISDKKQEHISYDISPKIKIYYLNNSDDVRIDEKIIKNFKDKHYLRVVQIIFKLIYFNIFGKYKYRRLIKKMTNNDDILLACMPETYKMMPKGRTLIYHYHFNSKYFFSFGEKINRFLFHKPKHFVFLSKIIFENIIEKKKKLKNSAIYIENPIKIEPNLNINYFNNNLVYIGRLADQKNPLLLIKVANVLKEMDLKFTLEMYGKGKLKAAIENEIKKYKLENYVILKGENNDVATILKNKDLMIVTSTYEGMPLVINEANSQSVPVVTTNFGDSTYDSVPNNCGVVVESFNPYEIAKEIFDLLNDKERLLTLRKNAFENSKRYSKETIINKWLDFLKTI